MKADIWGLAFSLALGYSVTAVAMAPTPVTWNAASCPPGRATVTTTATSANGLSYQVITPDVMLPVPTLTQSFLNIPATAYTARASVVYDTGGSWSSESQPLTGLGDAPVPLPSPTPTPTPTPTPSGQSPNCTKAATITDSTGGVWTFGPAQETLRNGVHQGGGLGSVYKFVDGVVWVLGQPPGSGMWFKFVAPAWVLIGVEPTCASGPTPTPSPSPTPVPISDLSQILAAMTTQTNTILSAIMSSHQAPPPVPMIPCTIVSMGSYASGNQKPTMNCPPSGLAVGMTVKVIK